LKRFQECVAEEEIQSKALLCMDVTTRWNSTYLMLETALKYQNAFDRLEGDLYYQNHFLESVNGRRIEGPPKDSDWENAKIFVKFLKTFYELTLRLSGTSYATSNLILQEICEVKQELNSLIEDPDNLMCQVATSMAAKYAKYWGNIDKVNQVLFLGTILDPRYKLGVVHHCLHFMYEPSVAEKMERDVLECLKKLYTEYNDFTHPATTPRPQPPTEATTTKEAAAEISSTSRPKRFLSTYLKERLVKEGGERNEIERYLSETCEDILMENFDILGWWKLNSTKYKVLSTIAKDILAVPMSTVASESAFSTGGRILDPYRSSLAPKMVEALVCLKNWMSCNHDTTICREFMDEVESFKDSVEVVTGKSIIIQASF
jgi:hypothetical protein